MQNTLFFIAIFLFLLSCEKDTNTEFPKQLNTFDSLIGSYTVNEQFEITVPYKANGRGTYDIELYINRIDTNIIYFVNFIGWDTVIASYRNKIIDIPKQQIESKRYGVIYLQSGRGFFYGDSIHYWFNTGSKAGLIESTCNAKKNN